MSENLAYQEEFAFREELIGGKLVAMSPRPAFNHNQVSYNIATLFANYLNGKKCTPIADGTDLYLTDNDRFIPDFMIVCDREKIKWDGVHGAPDLVVEVLSPGTAKNDKGHKKDAYEASGVREYWIVSPGEKSVEQYVLQNGRFVLQNIYTIYPNWMLDKMTDEEKADIVTHFQCSLYDDLEISLDSIFHGLLTPPSDER